MGLGLRGRDAPIGRAEVRESPTKLANSGGFPHEPHTKLSFFPVVHRFSVGTARSTRL
jgi:hypothetical protein